MERFEAPKNSPEASREDVLALRNYISEQYPEKSDAANEADDPEVVTAAAKEFFSNYSDTDIEAVVAALYAEDQAAARVADEEADQSR